MTVIAWDGSTLAADRRAISAGTSMYSITKIARHGDTLVAVSGEAGRIRAFQEWLKMGRDPKEYPMKEDADGGIALVIHRDGRIERFERLPTPLLVEDQCHAIGCGREYAMAAMYLGHGAVRAVEVAIALDPNCGHGIDTLRFDEDDGC